MMGYIGTFFARLAKHLENQNVEVYKIIFPMHEFGFPAHQQLQFYGDMSEFRPFLYNHIQRLGIRHIFMVNHLQIPHRIALDLCEDLREKGTEIDSFIFELGYLRPHYVTLENNGVNHTSDLIQPAEFYHSLPEVDKFIQSDYKPGLRWRKLWKGITFIQHAFTDYKIINGKHKLQPCPSFILFAVLGFFRKYFYSITERKIKAKLFNREPFFLAVLQVATDSQVSLGSRFNCIEEFITELIESFARFAPKEQYLFIKHHPRDRGYNNYSSLIHGLVKRYGLVGRVFYFHDYPMASILIHPSCSGVVLINSTVGYQALFHSVPLKSLGIAAYNIEGLADQQPLDHFWIKPNGPDRKMFKRFYQHVRSTTQINGNFDGNFPFKETFIVSDYVRNFIPPLKQ
tara:strand:- start:1174 stop:2373 length:1200 start_codon:yes stop_codon:yes gene_type:complete